MVAPTTMVQLQKLQLRRTIPLRSASVDNDAFFIRTIPAQWLHAKSLQVLVSDQLQLKVHWQAIQRTVLNSLSTQVRATMTAVLNSLPTYTYHGGNSGT